MTPATPAKSASKWIRRSISVAVVALIAVGAAMNWSRLSGQWNSLHASPKPQEKVEEARSGVELATAKGDDGREKIIDNTIVVERDILAKDKDGKLIVDDLTKPAKSSAASGRFTLCAVQDAPAPEPLRLNGSINTDQNRSARVKSLFAGSVFKIGVKGDMSTTSQTLSVVPEKGLQPGDYVKKGQILAIVFCKDVGEKKSELVDQTSQMYSDLRTLERYLSVDKGIISLTQLTTAIRSYMQDVIAMNRAERTLRSWQMTDEEIDAVKREAEKMDALNKEVARVQGDKFTGIKPPTAKTAADLELERSWAEVAIRAPFDGRITEKNVTVGDVVDPTVDLYKIAKLDRLQVFVHAYEEDLPKLQQLSKMAQAVEDNNPLQSSAGLDAERREANRYKSWKISYQANEAAGVTSGHFDRIGIVIDPAQHTGTVSGWVDNSEGKLFIGQFVTATIDLPADPNLVAVPAEAVVEDTDGTVVFVRTGDKENQFTRRKVAVAVRGRDKVFLRKVLTRDDVAQGYQAVKPGDVVMRRGALELAGELQALQSQVSLPTVNKTEDAPRSEKK